MSITHYDLPSKSDKLAPPLLGTGAWTGHIPFIYDLIAQTKPKSILELGVDRGESLLAMSDAAQKFCTDCSITGIDSWQGDPHTGTSTIHVYESVLNDIAYRDFSTTALRGFFSEFVEDFSDNSIDILHIDGFHTYQAVKADWELFFPKVKDNGLILLHDTRVIGGNFGVWKFFEEVSADRPSLEFPFFFGLGIIEKASGSSFKNTLLNEISKNLDAWSHHYKHSMNYMIESGSDAWHKTKHTEQVAEPFRIEDSYQKLKSNHVIDTNSRLEKCEEPLKVKYAPQVSIITPVFNPSILHIEAAFQSVIHQTYTNWQWILVDDGNSSDVYSLLKKIESTDPRIKVISHSENQHIASALNSGVNSADGKWICCLDQDDLLTSDALELGVTYINEYPEASILYSDEDKIDDSTGEFVEAYFKPGYQPDLILCQNYFNHLSFFKKEDAIAVGLFDDKYRGCQDWDLFLKIIKHRGHNTVIHIPYILYHWRTHSESTAQAIATKPYVIESTKRCVKTHGSTDASLELIGPNYVVQTFEAPSKPHIRIYYNISENTNKSSYEYSYKIHGSCNDILNTINQLVLENPDSIFWIQPSTQDIPEEIISNALGYANQDWTAFSAPQIYSDEFHEYTNAFRVDNFGEIKNGTHLINNDSDGYFMNMRLASNPDILDVSTSAFRASSWLLHRDAINSMSLAHLSQSVRDAGQYYTWMPFKTHCGDSFKSLFESGTHLGKTFLPKAHWVSPARNFFASNNEHSSTWNALRSTPANNLNH